MSFQTFAKYSFSLVKSRLALGSPDWLFGCHHVKLFSSNCKLSQTEERQSPSCQLSWIFYGNLQKSRGRLPRMRFCNKANRAVVIQKFAKKIQKHLIQKLSKSKKSTVVCNYNVSITKIANAVQVTILI